MVAGGTELRGQNLAERCRLGAGGSPSFCKRGSGSPFPQERQPSGFLENLIGKAQHPGDLYWVKIQNVSYNLLLGKLPDNTGFY